MGKSWASSLNEASLLPENFRIHYDFSLNFPKCGKIIKIPSLSTVIALVFPAAGVTSALAIGGIC